MVWNLYLNWRNLTTMTMKLFTEVDMLKKQLAEEVKEKYILYKRIKELTEEVNMLSEKITLSEKKRLQMQKSMV